MKKLIFLFTILCFGAISAQDNPVSFKISQSADTLVFNAVIEEGWHLYAAHLPVPDEGPLPTEIVFESSENFNTIGEIVESVGHTELDDAFGIEVKYFEKEAFFKQRLQVQEATPAVVLGTIYFMVCNDQMCIPFDVPFSYNFTQK